MTKFCDLKTHITWEHYDHEMIAFGSTSQKKDQWEISGDFFTKWKKLKICPLELQLDGLSFMFLVFRDHDLMESYFYVTLIGTKDTAKKYKFIIGISSQNDVSWVEVSTSL